MPATKRRKTIRFDLAAPPGVWQQSLPSSALCQAFGPAENRPGFVRLVKDALAVGRWKVGRDAAGNLRFWTVTRQTLADIAANFQAAKSRRVGINLTNTHGDPATGLVHPDDLIEPIDDLKVVGDQLYASVYVTPEEAARLRKRTAKVSPRIVYDWYDGLGNHYPVLLHHLAVTDHPVQPGQGEFMDLALTQSGGGSMDFARLVELINSLLPGEAKLPEGVTEETLVDTLALVIETLQSAGVVEGEPVEPDAAVLETDTGAGAATFPPEEPMALALQVLKAAQQKAKPAAKAPTKLGADPELKAVLIDMSNTLKAMQQQQASGRKDAFEAKLTQLGQAGVPAALLQKYRGLGSKYGYDLSLLDTAAATIDMSNVTRQFATAGPPRFSTGANARMTDEQVKKIQEENGLKPVKMIPMGRR